MSTRNYLIIGLISIFIILAFIVATADVPNIGAVIIGILTLLTIPLIVYWMRKIPRRDYKHQDDDDKFKEEK